LDNTRI